MNKMSDLISSLDVLNTEIDYIFANDISFLERFGEGDIMDLIEVSFTNQYVKIVYVLYCGQHICDKITMDDYLEWRNTILNL